MSHTRLELIQRIQAKVGDLGHHRSAPAISAATAAGGALAAGTVWYRVAGLGQFGETLPTAVASLQVASNNKITITIPRDPAPVGYAVFAGTASGSANALFQGSLRNWVEDQASVYTLSSMLATGRTALQDESTYGDLLPYDSYVDAANGGLDKYSQLEPQNVSSLYDLTSASVSYALPSNWVNDYSRVDRIEWPEGEQDPLYMDRRAWVLGEGVGSWWFRYDTPGESDEARFHYILPHTLPNATSTGTAAHLTAPDKHFEGLCAHGAEAACLEVAGIYAKEGRSDIGADTADRSTKADAMRRLGNVYGSKWKENWNVEKARAGTHRARYHYYTGRGRTRG